MPMQAADLLRRARGEGYALAALNAVNLETAEAIVAGAERERAPVILQISENAARYSAPHLLAAIASTLRAHASVPVILHFDHAESVESAQRALDLGFDSVMLEGRGDGPEENHRALRSLVEAAHAHGAIVEAEVEAVRKGDRGGGSNLPVDEVRSFAESTGCDILAIDIGTEHKQTRKEARLDHGRLHEIAGAVPHPLVLHGSSGVSEDDLRKAVAGGISKVNVSTALALAFTGAVREVLADESIHDPRKYLGPARERMTAEVRRYIRLLGASGTADASS